MYERASGSAVVSGGADGPAQRGEGTDFVCLLGAVIVRILDNRSVAMGANPAFTSIAKRSLSAPLTRTGA